MSKGTTDIFQARKLLKKQNFSTSWNADLPVSCKLSRQENFNSTGMLSEYPNSSYTSSSVHGTSFTCRLRLACSSDSNYSGGNTVHEPLTGSRLLAKWARPLVEALHITSHYHSGFLTLYSLNAAEGRTPSVLARGEGVTQTVVHAAFYFARSKKNDVRCTGSTCISNDMREA